MGADAESLALAVGLGIGLPLLMAAVAAGLYFSGVCNRKSPVKEARAVEMANPVSQV